MVLAKKTALVGLGFVGAMLADGGTLPRSTGLLAQIPVEAKRLTVRPRKAATGTENEKAGEQMLDSLPEYRIYVPQQAVGKKRVPLVVFFGGGGVDSKVVMGTDRPLADKYGMILLAPDIGWQSRWIDTQQVKDLDAALKQVLRKFAIDPDKIAVTGSSRGGHIALEMGCANLDVFSRVAPISPVPDSLPESCSDARRPPTQRSPFYLTIGIGEGRMIPSLLTIPSRIRRGGHLVLPVLGLRPHQWRVQDHDYVWRWLEESWMARNVDALRVVMRPAPVDTKMVPLLNDSTYDKTKTFWSWFTSQRETGGHSAPLAVKRVTIPVGDDQVSMFDFPDLVAVAASTPPVADQLTKIGLTPTQAESNLIAFIGAFATWIAKRADSTIKTAPIVQQNATFLGSKPAYMSDADILAKTLWNIP